MEQIAIFLLGIIVAILGYFLKRWWEGQSLKERIQKITDLLHLHNELSATNISETALSEFRRDIFSRSRWRLRDEQEVLDKIAIALREQVKAEGEDSAELRIQSELNQYAFHLKDLAEREMLFQVEALKRKLESEEVGPFLKVQSAWKAFAEQQAEFASLIVAGGTMQPLLRASEYRDLAIERAAKLKDDFRVRSAQIEIVPA